MTLAEALKVNGKAHFKTWRDECFLWYDGDIIRDENNHAYDFTHYHDHILSEEWEPYTVPCKHEPDPMRFWKSPNFAVEFPCIHCDVKIKATGWESV